MPMIRGAAIGLFSGIGIGFLSSHRNNGAMHFIKTTTCQRKNHSLLLLESYHEYLNLIRDSWKLPLYKQWERSKMFSMAVEQSMFPTRIPSMAWVKPINSAMQPYWWKRANSKSNPYLKWERTTTIGRIPWGSSAVVSRSHHHLPKSPLDCTRNFEHINIDWRT